jgi:methionyl-tRNA formyltransferase
MIGDLRVKVGPVTVDETGDALAPGMIRVSRDGVRIGTGSQPVLLGQVKPPGKRLMNATDWARGARLDESARAR